MRDTIDMAREAGELKCDCCLPYYEETDIEGFEGFLKRFEALVRADERNRTWTQEHWTEYERSIAAVEREACAKVCEERLGPTATDFYGKTYAAALRNRSNT
jgi:hypothetical protein